MSLLRIIRQQLGLSSTPANNFTFDASADNGTMKLARGNAGTTTQDILTVDALGYVRIPQNKTYCSATQAVDQSLPAAHWTSVLLQTSSINPRGWLSGFPTKFQPTIAGTYLLSGTVTGAGSATQLLAAFYKNSAISIGISGPVGPASGVVPCISISQPVYLNGTTDYINLIAYSPTAQNIGGSLSAILLEAD